MLLFALITLRSYDATFNRFKQKLLRHARINAKSPLHRFSGEAKAKPGFECGSNR